MTATHTPGTIKQFRRTAWRFEQTFKTPLDELPQFVATIMTAYGLLSEATLTIDKIVFDPDHLDKLIDQDAPTTPLCHDASISSSSPEEIPALLYAAFSDWVDFLFLPRPKRFVIYADHDEWVTFYASTKSNLNRIVLTLRSAGYQPIEGVTRKI